MNPKADHGPSRIEGLTLRALLHCYPPEFRSTFGPDVLATYRAAREDCRTWPGLLRLWRRTAVSLVRNGVSERMRRPVSARQSPPGTSGAVRGLVSLPQDVRVALRLLARDPSFTILATLVLALGIGANTAVFGISNTLLLKPRIGLGDRLVGLYSLDRTTPDTYRAFSYPNYEDLCAHHEIFASLAAHNFALVGVTTGETTRRVLVDVVTANFFDAFGVSPAIGRSFTLAEERPGADIPVLILSYGAWQRLGGHADVLGQTMRVNQREFTIIGVAPGGFAGSMVIATPDFWVPTGVYDKLANAFARDGQPGTLADRRHHSLVVVARLQSGVTMASAAPMLDAVATQLERAYPGENKNQNLKLAPLSRLSVSTEPETDSALTTTATVLLAMSGIVLLVASLNLANMLLARGGARRKEFAVRLALGGSRWRVVRQLLTESLVLSFLGGALGLALASWALHLLVSALTLGPALPIALDFDTTPDWRVFAATLGFCLISTLFFGLGPAWRLAKTDSLPELKDFAGEMKVTRRSRFFGLAGRDVLVMGQLALSLVLLATAGFFVRGALQAAHADPGFSLDHGILVNLDPSLAGYDASRSREIYRQTLASLRSLPGVEAVGMASIMPFGEFTSTDFVQRAGTPINATDPEAKTRRIAAVNTSIGADYFKSLGLAVRRGREFTAAEETDPSGGHVAIIDEPLARLLFGESDPIGQQVQVAPRDPSAAPKVFGVVGIAPAIRHQLFDREPRPHIYAPFSQDATMGTYLHVRTGARSADAEAAMLPAIRKALQSVDPRLPVLSLETQAMFRARNLILWTFRAGAAIFAVFGLVALVMAVIGVYGVKAYIVTRRTREIGIRVALGAVSGRVVWMVVKEGLTLSATGLVIGVALSALTGAAMRGLLYRGGQGLDTAVIAIALVTLAGSALLASWLPARRATRIAPIRALRAD